VHHLKRRAQWHASRTDQHDGLADLNIGSKTTARAPYHAAILAPTRDNVAKSNFHFSYATPARIAPRLPCFLVGI
jgi:hypothetical protein